MVKILYFNWFGTHHVGGIELYLKFLIGKLEEESLAHAFLFTSEESIDNTKKNQIALSILNRSGESNENDYKNYFDNYRDILKSANVFHFHNLHVFNPNKAYKLIAGLYDKYPEKAFILSLHNVPKDINMGKTLVQDFPGKIIAPSLYFKNVIKEVYNRDSEILQYYIELPTHEEIEFEFKSDTIIFFQPTRFSNWKGSHLSMAAFVNLYKLGYRNFRFIHAGVTEEEFENSWDKRWLIDFPELLVDVNKLINQRIIQFIKYRPNESYTHLNDCHYILHPTIGIGINGDPNPIAILQSMLIGKSIIASDSGNIGEMVKDYVAKIIINPNNLEELQNAIENILRNNLRPIKKYPDKRLYVEISNAPSTHCSLYAKLVPKI